jgi:hypothetical protein
MNNEIVRIPLYIRQGFETLKQEVKKKFPQAKSVVPSVLFLRYLGPTIIQPHTYGLIERTSQHTHTHTHTPNANYLISIIFSIN